MILSALPLVADTTIVSSDVSALFGTGDALSITVPSRSFSSEAAIFRLPVYPTEVQFTFVSAVENSPGQFQASLESGDDSVSVSFGALSFLPGTFQGSSYSGPISVLTGSVQLTEALSQQLFGSSAAVLVLLNAGPAVTVGLSPYSLQQDVNLTLEGGGLTVGALPGEVTLTDPPPSLGGGAGFTQLDSSDPPDPPTPEADSGLLMLGGGALLCVLATLRKSRLARGAEGALERDADKLAAGSHASLLE
jgi:hypothetical protein